MMPVWNIYCDESCHLEHDHQPLMVLGAVSCPRAQARETADQIRAIKVRHHLASEFEVKWSKVSNGKIEFYRDLVEFFFGSDALSFRAILLPDKDVLRHDEFQQDHDTFSYEMYGQLLAVLIKPEDQHCIYVDIKDTQTAAKAFTLQDLLCRKLRNHERDVAVNIQPVRSREVQQIQLADLLIGAISYVNRGLHSTPGKTEVVEQIRRRSGQTLTHSTLQIETKVSLLRWNPGK